MCVSQALQPQEYVPLLLSMYQVVTMSRASTLPSMQLLPEVHLSINIHTHTPHTHTHTHTRTHAHTHTCTHAHTLKLMCILYISIGEVITILCPTVHCVRVLLCPALLMSVQVLGKLNEVIINCKALPKEVRIHIHVHILWEPCTPFHTYVNTAAETDGPSTGI